MHAMVGNRSGETHRLGDRVTVKLVEAAPVAGALRFELLSEGRVMTGAQRRPSDRPGGRRTPGAPPRKAVPGEKAVSGKAPMTDVPPELMQKFTTDAMAGHPNVTPKDASTLILLDRSGAVPKVLMGKRHRPPRVHAGRLSSFPAAASMPIDRKMPVAAALDPRAEQKLMLHMRRPNAAKARGACARRRSAKPSRRPGSCSAPRRRHAPPAPDGAVGGLCRSRHPARPLHRAFHRPRRHPAPPEAALRHPLLHRRRQHHRAQDRGQGRRRFRAGRAGLAAARSASSSGSN